MVVWRRAASMTGPRATAYTWCAAAGLVLGTVIGTVVLRRHGEPQALALLLLLSGMIGSLVTAVVTRAVVGRNVLVAMHHLVAVTVAGVLAGRLSGASVPALLDAMALGLATIIGVGRLGCLAVGCCHGRPGRWGIRYRSAAARAGLPAYLAEVRLAPVQAFESVLAGTITVVGVVVVMRGAAPGTVAPLAAIGYLAGRFALEFWRGDGPRPSWQGLTHAQWTAAGLSVALLVLSGPDPRTVGLSAGVAAALVRTVGVYRRHGEWVGAWAGRHAHELALVVSQVRAQPSTDLPQIVRSSLGLALSHGTVDDGGHVVGHITLTFPDGTGSGAVAATVRRVRMLATVPSTVVTRRDQVIQLVLARN